MPFITRNQGTRKLKNQITFRRHKLHLCTSDKAADGTCSPFSLSHLGATESRGRVRVSRSTGHAALLGGWVIRNLADRTGHPQPPPGELAIFLPLTLIFSHLPLITSQKPPVTELLRQEYPTCCPMARTRRFSKITALQSDSTLWFLLTKVKNFFSPPPENGPDSQQSPVSVWYHNCHK